MLIPLLNRSFLFAAALVAYAAAAQNLPTATPEQAGFSAERLAKITRVFKQEVEQGKLPGAVMMIVRKNRLVYSESVGFQNKDSSTPLSKDAIFRIYSMTKPMVSVAAMMLVEDGKMQLNDPVSKHLPLMKGMQVSVAKADAEFAKITYSTVAADREMTVYDLLRHTAGLAYGELTVNAPVKEAHVKAGLYLPNMREFDSRDMSPAEQVERLSKIPLIHQPGALWDYSLASDLLGRVVEAVSGKRLGEFLETRLFSPLKMADSGFWLAPDKLTRLAQPLAIDPASGAPNRLIDVAAQPKNDSGGAGGVASANDCLRFALMLANGGQLDGARILSRTTVNLMTSDHLGNRVAAPVTPGELLFSSPGYTFGLGFAVRTGAGMATIPGSAGEFMWGGYGGTFFWVDPKEEIVAVYMSQAPGPSRQYYRRLFKQLVYQAVAD
ncbi:MAG: beta-lactamase family protein [Pseudomonadota bacterium]|nr:beta-lactamase family protein [Pseudomonadota bacterium]